jgi:polyisoprenoid-binding protein YceI
MVGFSIGFVGLPVRGTFDDASGTIVYVPGRPEASAVTVAIATASVHTGSAHRDGHLKSSDFFDAAKYPTILFQSTGIEKRGSRLIMHGNLRMHGVTREVSFPFAEAKGSPVAEPHGATLVQFSAALRLARRDFGIVGGSTYNDWFDTIRQASMADSVDINLQVTGWDPDYQRNHRYDAALARIDKDGVPATVARLRQINSTTPDSLRNSEWELSQIGHALVQRGHYADAVQILTVTTEIFPKSAEAQSALARAYELQGNRDQAVVHTRAALALSPELPHALELRRRLRA